jgi:DNA replication protein DnaC
MEVNEKVLKRFARIKEECKKCSGRGFSVVIENNSRTFVDCDCVLKIRKALSYIEANIPLRYVKWDISELTEEFQAENPIPYNYVIDYLANLRSNIDDGIGFWLAGPPGQAKSSIISYVMRRAVDVGAYCFFEKAANLHSKKFEALSSDAAKNFIINIIDSVELLAVEEIDKIYLKDDLSFNNKSFFDLISDIYDSNKALVISSNVRKDEVLKRFPPFISDRLSTLDYIELKGSSGRR